MKLVLTILVIFLSVNLFSCHSRSYIDPSISTQSFDYTCFDESFSNNSDTIKQFTHQYLNRRMISGLSLDADVGMVLDISENGVYGLTVIYKELGVTTNENGLHRTVYILADYHSDDKTIHDSYLAVEINEGVLFWDFGNYSLDESLYLCDVDGDGLEEIVVQQLVDELGGAGQYSSRIFKVLGEDILEIFDYRTFDSYGNYVGSFDTGYYSLLRDNYLVEILNRYTNYSEILDFSTKKEWLEGYYTEEGSVVSNKDIIECSCFFEFKPKDVDNDGVFEIECLQTVRSMTYNGYSIIGNVKSILKYRPSANIFEVIEALFYCS